jgi:methyltransferase family protein
MVTAWMNARRPLWFLAAALLSVHARAQGMEKELDTPYVPTPQAVVDRMLELAKVRSGDLLIDLGSGDGRMVITAATKFGARGFGVEIDPRLVRRSNEAAAQAGVADRVKFLQQDLFKTDFREANVLTLYLLPDVNLALRPKILSELRPGARVVSHDYAMGDWRPDAQETVPAPDKTVGMRKESQVYLWTVPAQVGGEWALEVRTDGGTRRMQLRLAQLYQFVSGTVEVPGVPKPAPLSGGRLRGDELRLMLPAGVAGQEPVELTGRVAGSSAGGTASAARRSEGTWTARRSESSR